MDLKNKYKTINIEGFYVNEREHEKATNDLSFFFFSQEPFKLLESEASEESLDYEERKFRQISVYHLDDVTAVLVSTREYNTSRRKELFSGKLEVALASSKDLKSLTEKIVHFSKNLVTKKPETIKD